MPAVLPQITVDPFDCPISLLPQITVSAHDCGSVHTTLLPQITVLPHVVELLPQMTVDAHAAWLYGIVLPQITVLPQMTVWLHATDSPLLSVVNGLGVRISQ